MFFAENGEYTFCFDKFILFDGDYIIIVFKFFVVVLYACNKLLFNHDSSNFQVLCVSIYFSGRIFPILDFVPFEK